MDGEKKKRKPNWTNEECLCLAHSVAEYKSILRCKLGPTVTSEKKKSTWKVVTDRLNASFTSNKRTQDEVEKKWHNIFSQSKAEIGAFKREQTLTGGGPCSKPLGEVAKVVWGILGEDNAVLDGIQDGIDSSLLQLLPEMNSSNPTPNATFQPVASTSASQHVPVIPVLATGQSGASTSQTAPPSVAFHWTRDVPPPPAPISVPKSNSQIIEELTIRKLSLEIELLEFEVKQKKNNQEE